MKPYIVASVGVSVFLVWAYLVSAPSLTATSQKTKSTTSVKPSQQLEKLRQDLTTLTDRVRELEQNTRVLALEVSSDRQRVKRICSVLQDAVSYWESIAPVPPPPPEPTKPLWDMWWRTSQTWQSSNKRFWEERRINISQECSTFQTP